MFRARSQKRQAGRPKDARYYRLRLEPLEDRRLLSVFTVNSPADHAELLVEIIGGSASPLRSASADGLVEVAYGQSASNRGGQRVIDADAALGGDESEGTAWDANADDPSGDGVLPAVGDPVPNDYVSAEAEPEKLTLRQAIQKANKNPGLDEIRFQFDKSEYGDGPYVIKPVYALPAITDPVVINGFTPGLGASPNTNLFHQGKNTVIQVWLEGSLAGKGTNGLVFEVPDAGVRSEVHGLAISGFQPTGDCNVVTEGFGIVLGGAGNVAVEHCFLGIAPDGYLPMVNASGIGLFSPKNVIQDNLIGANLYNGIQVGGRRAGTPVAGVTLNILWDNYIGTTRDGDFPMGNDNGIRVTEGASQTVIGGADHGNLLSGNRYQGVLIDKTAGGSNTIAGNLIGTDKTGMTTDPDKTPESGDELGNGDDGIDVGGPGSTSTVNVIGGTDPADRNVIAGNGGAGVLIVGAQVNNTQVKGNLIGTDITGTKKLGNAGPGVELQNSPDNTVQSNVSSGNGGVGVVIFGADAKRNVVRANRLGTSLDGKTALGNLAGVAIWHGSDNVIADNVMSGNTIHGAYVEGESARNNLFTGNKIGTNLAGNAALSNVCDGIRIQGAPDNIIGGAALADHNVISGNKHAGLHIEGAKAKNTSVQGNYIGTDVLGTSPVPNGVGVRIVDAPQNAIGGTVANFGDRPRNVISGNQDAGIVIQGAGAKGNWIQGNYIGTDKDGAGTNMGNRGDGILIDGAPENVVGGETTTPGKTPGNIISANWDAGVHIKGAGAKKNRVQGNVIGLDKSGNNLGNIEQGVFIEDAPDSEIGDKTKGITGPASFSKKHNVISGNVGEGVRIEGNGAVGNCVRRNKIYRNDGLEINLDGNEDLRLADDDVTPNDWKDGDTGANHLMNFPVGLTAWDSGTQTTISGVLSTADPENAEVDIYVGKTRDATGFGEGEVYKGTVKPDESGWFSLIVPGFSLSYPWLLFSAVATDTTTYSTSEFSPVYGINPTTSKVDSDGDGFPDEWETGGIDFNGDAVVDLPLDTGAEPANPNQKDIFLEIDYMESPSRTLRPDAGFELLMYTAFAAAPGGIVLHVEVDEPVPYSGAILWDTTHPGPANDFDDYKLGNPVNPTGTGPGDGHFGSLADRGLRDANGTDAPAGYRIGAKGRPRNNFPVFAKGLD
ncbi:MAG TPA: right-handed parallel beta-helix repeat-containing protein [Thermoguttaceae bacterium]|nr:right-handed parallel beta-helix repeat-containing protein [Thermoguttaceae bacterium]